MGFRQWPCVCCGVRVSAVNAYSRAHYSQRWIYLAVQRQVISQLPCGRRALSPRTCQRSRSKSTPGYATLARCSALLASVIFISRPYSPVMRAMST